MFNNNLTFSTDGPIMSGTWFNPNTGDSFTVRDSLFEDNQYVVYTMDGRVLKYDQLQNYVQSKSENSIPDLNKIKQENKKNEALPPEVASLIDNDINDQILPDDMDMIYNNSPKTLGNLNNKNNVFNNVNELDQNLLIINKALSKCDFPEFDIKIKWNNKFPTKEISLLTDLMDIKIEEIINYYISNINFDKIAADINNEILNNIKNNLNIKNEVVEAPIKESNEPKEPKKAASKKTTTKKTK